MERWASAGVVTAGVFAAHVSRLGGSGGFATAFASKPAPTFDRVPSLECGQMWERACSRRGPQQRCITQPASNQTPVAAEAAPATRTSGAAAAGRNRTSA
ncbi:hypothetical protein FIV38_04405 [Pseudomonas proteolytica]|nr:hypothetical protein F4W61_15600 [Pseudomonas proteolytica]TWR85248.1 hypothetical protein FIV38_04405 [Pseudomonas proteolytica]